MATLEAKSPVPDADATSQKDVLPHSAFKPRRRRHEESKSGAKDNNSLSAGVTKSDEKQVTEPRASGSKDPILDSSGAKPALADAAEVEAEAEAPKPAAEEAKA